MTINCIEISPVPLDESRAQYGGTTEFRHIARIECATHCAALVAKFGPPPNGVKIESREVWSTLGTFYELAIRFDDADLAATAYAHRLRDERLSRWHDAGFQAPFIYGKWGEIVSRVHPALTSAVRAAIATLGQFPDRAELTAMRANLIAVYPEAAPATKPPTTDPDCEAFTRSTHLGLLARAKAAINTPGALDNDTRNALIAQIDEAVTRFSTYSLPWPVSTYVGVVEHSEGVNHYLGVTRSAVTRQLAQFCRSFWSEIPDDRDPEQLGDETVVSEYFRQQEPHEFHRIDVEELMPEPAINAGYVGHGRALLLDSRHLTPSTLDHLVEWSGPVTMTAPLYVSDTPMGLFIPTDLEFPFDELPDDLETVLAHACTMGVDYLVIGSDGAILEDLPLYS